MLKDIFFYPLAAIIMAVMIMGALSLGDYEVLTKEQIRAQGFTVEGEDLSTLTAAPGTNVDFMAQTSNESAFVRLYTNIARDDAPISQGVFATLNANYNEAFSQKSLRLTLKARASPRDGLDEFDMAYFALEAGATGWQSRSLTKDWQEYTLTFTPSGKHKDGDLSYYSIWPGRTGEPLKMDIKYMRIEVISSP